MRRDEPWDGPLYRVFEEIDGPAGKTLHTRMVGGYDEYPRGSGNFLKSPYNDKKRLYTDLTTARTYKKRLAKEGRVARIFRYVQESEVE